MLLLISESIASLIMYIRVGDQKLLPLKFIPTQVARLKLQLKKLTRVDILIIVRIGDLIVNLAKLEKRGGLFLLNTTFNAYWQMD